jgi:peptidoglycan hydrolase-like protein with peptidoglycan-binding domain
MASIVVDYAWSHPTIAKLKSLGAIGVARYLSTDSSKNLSKSEYSALKSAKLAVTLVWETTANRALSGYAGGKWDAQRADQLADDLGYPNTAAIYFAVDFDANPAQRKVVTQYLKGANDGTNRPVGVYGSYYVLEDAAANNTADYFWQTQAWSGGKVSSHRDFLQVVAGSTRQYDINYVNHPDWGQDVKHFDHPDGVFPPFPLARGSVFGDNHVTSGHNLHLWQEKMSHRGWTITADDQWGPETKGVVHAFQQEKNLDVDDLIGPRTWNAAWKAPVT